MYYVVVYRHCLVQVTMSGCCARPGTVVMEEGVGKNHQDDRTQDKQAKTEMEKLTHDITCNSSLPEQPLEGSGTASEALGKPA